MSTTISEDILHELLSFLLSNDLLRFRCVSKSWRALIDSPYFIQLHLNKSLENMNSRKALGIPRVIGYDLVEKYIFAAISFDSEFNFAVTREINPPIQNFYILDPIGSCRSLICLRLIIEPPADGEPVGGENDKILWNPSARSHRILPFAPIEIIGDKERGSYFYFRYAFGYDEVSDDYKVVRMTFEDDNDDYEAKVYSLNLDTWKEIDTVPLPYAKFGPPLTINGAIIWVVDAIGDTSCVPGWDETVFSILVLPLRTQVFAFYSIRNSGCLSICILFHKKLFTYDVWCFRHMSN